MYACVRPTVVYDLFLSEVLLIRIELPFGPAVQIEVLDFLPIMTFFVQVQIPSTSKYLTNLLHI